MQIDATDIAADLWKHLVDYVPARDREAAAEQFIGALRRLEFSDEDIHLVAESDHYLSDILDAEAAEDADYEHADDYDDTDDF